MRTDHSKQPTITSIEVARALYIDFEGNQDLPPSFIGIRFQDGAEARFEQVIVEQALVGMLALTNPTEHGWAKGYKPFEEPALPRVLPRRRSDTLAGMVNALVRRAEAEDRLILSWSCRERDVITETAGISESLKARFIDRWRDAKALAKDWKKKVHRAVVFPRITGRGRHRLDCYMDLIGYRLPSYFGDRQAAQRIGYVRQQLEKRGSAQALTPVAKAKWTKVIDYNWHDCNGMREVTMRAAKEMEN